MVFVAIMSIYIRYFAAPYECTIRNLLTSYAAFFCKISFFIFSYSFLMHKEIPSYITWELFCSMKNYNMIILDLPFRYFLPRPCKKRSNPNTYLHYSIFHRITDQLAWILQILKNMVIMCDNMRNWRKKSFREFAIMRL